MTAQNIQFRGIRRSPSDITGQDGDLLDCVNLVHEDGELKPIAMPERSNITVPVRNNTPYILAHIHNTTDGAMFVFVWKQDNGDDMLVVQDADNITKLSRVANDSLGQSVKWVQSVGNTLVIGTDKSIHYALYKNNEYKWLGDSLPRPVIDFQLEFDSTSQEVVDVIEPVAWGVIKNGDADERVEGIPIYGNDITFGPYTLDPDRHLNELNKGYIKDNLKSKLSTAIQKAKERKRFIYPFFIRYALRLFDGSYVMHSQPILILPSSYPEPILAYFQKVADQSILSNYHTWNIRVVASAQPLKYKFMGFYDDNNTHLNDEDVSQWDDIIKGVDLFMSSAVTTYDAEVYEYIDNIPDTYESAPPSSTDTREHFGEHGAMYHDDSRMEISEFYRGILGPVAGAVMADARPLIPMPSIIWDDVVQKTANNLVFYKFKHYSIDKALHWGNDYKFFHDECAIDALTNLESMPTLHDDYLSRGRITSETGHTYNKRLILGNLSAELPLWYPITELGNKTYNLCFVVEKNGKTINIYTNSKNLSYYRFGHYIYYPDPDCKKVIVYTLGSASNLYEVKMTEHEGLNGAYAIMPDFESLGEAIDDNEFDVASELPQNTPDRYYPMRNSIAMAEVANPFTWQAENFKEAGNGSVIDLAPNMIEVSSGQWGQYPLYVFSTDGIYAFGINNDGTLGAMSPVSSDVLLIPQGMGKPSLIQANQMLVFTTSRGVMGLQGTQAQPLSLVMDGRHFNAKDDLGLDVLYASGAFKSIVNETYDTKPFHDFVLSGFLAYDYAHNRVLVLNDDSKYQYVLSLDSGLWSRQVTYRNLDMIQMSNQAAQEPNSRSLRSSSVMPLKTISVTKISAAANNYTEMYLQGNDNRLYVTQNVTEENNNPLYQYGYFVSRPVRFGTDEFKTITRLLHRYTHYAPNSDVKLAMYGSRDGVNYGRINTLRGMSWKYYIFVVYTYLKPNERYSYMAVDFEPRLTNKLR